MGVNIATVIYILAIHTIIQFSVVNTKVTVKNTKLLMTYLIHRHGDRTPVESLMSIAEDKEALLELIQPYGFEQLTTRGKQRSYNLGKFIRRRYKTLLSESYNSSEIYIRSTDITRTKMTVLTAMAAVFPPGENRWSYDINWEPVPYTTRPQSEDPMFPTSSCQTYIEEFGKLLDASPPEMQPFVNLTTSLSEANGLNFALIPLNSLYVYYDFYISQISAGLPLKPSIASLMPELEKAAGVAVDLIFGNCQVIARGIGTLLQEFYDVSAKIIAGEDVERVRIYSAHDATVFSWTAITKAFPKQGVPKYGSAYALELRRDKATGQHFVLPVYLNTPEEKEIYLTIDGCDDVLCELDKFKELTSENAVTETEWRSLCEKL